jgi:recombination protein RecT
MNALEPAPTRKASQVDLYISEVLPENSPILRALPAGIDPKRFKNSLQIAIMVNPSLLKCDPRLTFREVARAANYGISLDPSLGEGWLIVRRSSKTGRDEPQFQLGWKGKAKLARQSGEIARLVAYPVSERCMAEGRFKITLQTLVYEPDPFNDDSPPCGYFAYVLYKDGTEDFETMSIREIHKIRDRSDGWRAFKAQKIRSTPWSEFEGEMARKTVLNRLLKRVPMSADVVEFLRQDDEADFTEIAAEDAQPPNRPPPRQTRTETLRAIASQSDEPAPKRGRPKKEVSEQASDNSDIVENESETQGERDEPESEDVVQERIDDEPVTPVTPVTNDPFPGDAPAFDRKSKDYQRGREDFAAGLKRCLNAEIRAEPQRFENWKAGWLEAKEEAEEAENGREDT